MCIVTFIFPNYQSTETNIQAVIQQFGVNETDVEIQPQASIGACFEQLHSRSVDFAVVPFENSTNGQVVFTYDLLRDWLMPKEGREPAQFRVVAEQFVAIHHYLLSNADDLSKVTNLYSHPQVWGQVTKFLSLDVLPGKYSKIDTSSTAQAAEFVKNDDTNTSACISSQTSAHLYGVPIKAAAIEDFKGNTTRFLVLGYSDKEIEHGEDGEKPNLRTPIDSSPDRNLDSEEVNDITLLMFVLNADDPGALCLALGAFQKNNVNLTSISSRPSGRTRWQYIFYLEAAGNAKNEAMHASINLLKPHCTQLAIVGTFARSWRYGEQE